jgi:anaerobic magnesium-protoporphyrin IX monomethyl ester cyclase
VRVLLTHPPSPYSLRTVVGIKSAPLGLAYLAAVAQRGGHETRIVDAPTLGLSAEKLRAEIVGWRPDLLGVSSTAIGHRDALQLVREVKEHLPDVFTVLGGPHVTFLDEETLQSCPPLDAVVRGEGELTFAELLELLPSPARLATVTGLTYRDGDRVVRNPDRPLVADLDSLGFPAYHLLPMGQYRLGRSMQFSNMLSSRGCPYRCTFCASSSLFGKRWRCHSPEHVVAEMELLRDRFGVRHIEILDDTFTLSHERVRQICDRLLRRNVGIWWTASSRVGTLTPDLARTLYRAGCRLLFFGFESASQPVLDFLCKGIKVEQARETVAIARRAGLQTMGSFILGTPVDTRESIRRTIRLARTLALNYAEFTLLTPYPGTPLYEQVRAQGLRCSGDWSNYTMMWPTLEHPTIPAATLKKYVDWAYLSFYLRPRHIWLEIRERNLYFVPIAFKALLTYAFQKR